MLAMDAARWQQLSDWFDRAVVLARGDREAFVLARRDEDAELALKLERLLAADAEASGLLDHSIARAMPADAMPAPPAIDRSGERIGAYRLCERIGRGGMGDVYRAEREGADYAQVVALKLLRRGVDSEDVVRRFAQERRILAALEHPGIARLIDGGLSPDGLPFLVMEYVEGLPLAEFAAQRELSLSACIELVIEVCAAVAYAHRRLIVHRDIKPSNVLVGADGRPKLLDFGIAKLLDDDQAEAQTGTGLRPMSPAYAAPEQVLGKTIGTATDVYALGVVLYELITGQLPHRRGARSLEGLAREVETETVERPSVVVRREHSRTSASGTTSARLARRIDGDLDTIVLKALKREPDRRYGSAAELADDLRRFLEGRPIAARADTLGYRVGRFARRHRGGVATAILTFIGLIGGFGIAVWQADVAQREAARAEAEASRARVEAVRAEREAEKSDRVGEFLVSLFEAANPMARSTTEPPTVATVIASAAERVDRDLAQDPELQLAVLTQLGAIAIGAEVLDEARRYAERAYAMAQANPGFDAALIAEAHRLQGEALLHRGEPIPAEAVFRAGLAALEPELRSATPRRRVLIAAAITGDGLGSALFYQDRVPESADVLREVAAKRERLDGRDSLRYARAQYNVCVVDWRLGSLDTAAACLEQVLASYDRHLKPNDLRVGLAWDVLAKVRQNQQRMADAEAAAERASAIALHESNTGDKEIASILQTLGNIRMERGRFAQARAITNQSLPLAAATGNLYRVAGAHRTLGLLAMWEGRYDEAIAELGLARDSFVQARGGAGIFPHLMARTIAYVHGLAGRHEQSLRELAAVREPIVALVGAEGVDELQRLVHVGEIELQAGRAEAATATLRQARDLADAKTPLKDITPAHHARAWHALATLAHTPGDAAAIAQLRAALARLEAADLGWHPTAKAARAALGAPR